MLLLIFLCSQSQFWSCANSYEQFLLQYNIGNKSHEVPGQEAQSNQFSFQNFKIVPFMKLEGNNFTKHLRRHMNSEDSFIQQIFYECLLYTRHCFRCRGNISDKQGPYSVVHGVEVWCGDQRREEVGYTLQGKDRSQQ